MDQKIYGAENIVTTRAEAMLGAALLSLQRQAAQAEPLLRHALAVERRQPPTERIALAMILEALGRVLSVSGQVQEATALVQEFVDLTRQNSGAESEAYAKGL